MRRRLSRLDLGFEGWDIDFGTGCGIGITAFGLVGVYHGR